MNEKTQVVDTAADTSSMLVAGGPTVVIHDFSMAEPELLSAVLQRISHYERAKKVNIFVQPRVPADAPSYKHPGFVEYLIVTEFVDGGKMTVGAIQRAIGASTEFHS